MPGSILINDGRRSASPDRRVTFGNIERYDIMTSNEIRNNMNKKRDNGEPATVNGDYPMTRLDNRIRKALMLGFSPMPGDSVTYDEIIDFLMEFKVIANNRICTERQITAIVQASFPKVVTKPSAKYNIIFVNLENNSDDVIKEELVRVTTEPIIDPASREARAWITEEVDEDKYESSDNGEENAELTEIENNKQVQIAKVEITHSPPKQLSPPTPRSPPPRPQQNGVYDESSNTSTPIASLRDDATDSSAPYHERSVDVLFERSPRFNDSLQSNRVMSKSTGDVRNGASIRRNTSFSKKNIDRSVSVIDVAKRFENNSVPDEVEVNNNNNVITKATSTSNLQRKRSFTKSTNPSFVGSIRDKFRSSLRKKSSNNNNNESKSQQKEDATEKKSSSVIVRRGTSSKTSFSSKTTTSSSEKPPVTKIGANNEVRLSVNKSSRSTNGRFGGSSIDVRNAGKQKPQQEQTAVVNKSLSNSATDIRSASFRANASKQINNGQRTEEVRGSFRATSVHQSVNRNASDCNNNTTTAVTSTNAEVKSNFVRASGYRSSTSQSNDPRSSIRRNTTNTSNDARSSVRKTNENKPTVVKSTSSVRISNSNVSTNVGRVNSARNTTPRENNTAKRTGTGLRRNNSRAGTNNRNSNNSNSSSAASTPNISRENSRTSMKIPVRCRPGSPAKQAPVVHEPTQQEKDILRIAKAFQKASNEIDTARDNVEQFMVSVVIDDIEPSTNSRLNMDDLYDHIRHRMILSQQKIFDGYRSDIRVDMSQYFDLFFTALAAHMSRVGCEIVTDSTTRQKICYLTHVKLIDYADDLQALAADQQSDSEEEMQASYV